LADPLVGVVGQVVEAGRVVNIQSVVYRIAPVIEVTDKILENGVEMIAWALIPFLIDEYRGFPAEVMVDHCMDFLCRGFLVFLEFVELLVEVEMGVVASENSSLLTIHGVGVYLMVDEMVL
jgi:hypothetical protein